MSELTHVIRFISDTKFTTVRVFDNQNISVVMSNHSQDFFGAYKVTIKECFLHGSSTTTVKDRYGKSEPFESLVKKSVIKDSCEQVEDNICRSDYDDEYCGNDEITPERVYGKSTDEVARPSRTEALREWLESDSDIAYDDSRGHHEVTMKRPEEVYLSEIESFRLHVLLVIDNEMDDLLERKAARPLKSLTMNEKNQYDLLKKLYIKIMNLPFDNPKR